MKEKKLVLRVDLKGDSKRKFLQLKDKLDFENNTDLIRYLIMRVNEKSFRD